ncbi:hypothetical protein ISU02_04455 [Fusibacter sp. Q10-2]|uniref:VWA-like domain-containing protein n=2 Tax=Fusibacter ferrireducens TaxID=2785058 RepID=A0ABR9ZPH1_9FIRM|nr:hypothetical protein [Fusibacter ferrireducens]
MNEPIAEQIQKDQMVLILRYPFYGLLLMKLEIQIGEQATSMMLKYDQRLVVRINPIWYAEQSDEIRLKNWIHLLGHIILLHHFRRGERDEVLWSVSADLAVNELIDTEEQLENSVTVRLLNASYKLCLLEKKSVEYYYDALSQLDEPLLFDDLEQELILKLPTKEKRVINRVNALELSTSEQSAIECELSEFMDLQKDQDEVPEMLSKVQNEIFDAYHIHWRILLKKFITGRGRISKRNTYKKMSRRFDMMPGKRRQLGIEAFVAIDESGSIPMETWTSFLNELKLLKNITNAKFWTSRFDQTCSEPISLEQFIQNDERQKQGSTDYRPIFEVACRYRYKLIIIFTDGEGIFPEKINGHVLWLLTKKSKIPEHMGYVIQMQ